MALLRPMRRTLLLPIAAAAITAVLAACGSVPDQTAGQEPATRSSAPPASPVAPSTPATPSPSRPAAKQPVSAPSEKASGQQTRSGKSADEAQKLIFRPGDDRAAVRELQARLQQLSWYQGKITGHYGADTTSGVKGFQHKRKLPATGSVDRSTWSRLVAMTKEPTHDQLYNIVPAGPPIMSQGDQAEQVRQLQARLKQLDWFTENVTGFYGSVTAAAVRGFQDKRGLPATGAVDQTTWSRLVAMTHEPTQDELSGSSSGAGGVVAADLDQRCLTGRAMCIDKTTRQLVWVIDGKPQLRFDVRFGADTTPTREGSFSVGWKAREWTSTLYHSEMPYSMFFSGGQAVHYSSDFAARGYYGASHGCVNVRDLAGIRTLFDQARVGDKVIVYRS